MKETNRLWQATKETASVGRVQEEELSGCMSGVSRRLRPHDYWKRAVEIDEPVQRLDSQLNPGSGGFADD
jgi:hypothetical protein